MTESERLEQAIAALEAQRTLLGDAVVETALAPLREKLAALAGPPAAEERQLVTVLFADLAGFTARAEQLDAEEVQDLLDEFWRALDPIILEHGGHIHRHMGDGVVAVWGWEQAREDDPAQAVRAALALQEAMGQHEAARRVGLPLRVGINTGLVAIGAVSSVERELAGDTVNLASRLERAAPPGGILISQATGDRVRGLFDMAAQPPLTVKGKAEPVQTYLVYRERPRAFHMPTRGLAGVATRTVGRDAELAVLQAAYQQAREGAGIQWITVSGEAGVGKSRLLIEFVGWLDAQPEAIVHLRGRAWTHTQHSPYFLLRDLLSYGFQIRDGDSLDEARARLTAGLTAVLGDELGPEAAAFIGQLAGFDFRCSPWIAGIVSDTQQIRGRAEVLLREVLARLCARGPVVLLLEDLHWADAESLRLLAALLAEPQPWRWPVAFRLCAVGLARPEFWERRTHWGTAATGEPLAHHRRLDLQPLANELARELVRELLQRLAEPSEWLVELLVEHSGGNPYFAEELVHWLIEEGVIETGPEPGSAWRVTAEQLTGLSVPATVQGVLQARLEQLSPAERAMLQQAAVLGRAFWADAVAYIGQEPVPAARWAALQERDLVFQRQVSQLAGEDEYLFKHVLLRDVVYEYTLKKLRRVYHRRAAEWLTQVAAERAAEWAAIIAQHYEQAGEAMAAAEWYGRAGRQAQDTYAPAAAIEYYEKALGLLPAEEKAAPRGLDVYYMLGEMLSWQARLIESAEAYVTMIEIARTVGDLPAQARAWNSLANVQDRQGDYLVAHASALQAEEIARLAGLSVELMKAVHNRGFALFHLGRLEEALALGEQALALATTLDDRSEMARDLTLLGGIYDLWGHYERAADTQKRSLELYRSLGNRKGVGVALNNLGENARLRGNHDAAVAYFAEAVHVAREIGDRHGEMMYLCGLGGARVGRGDYELAEADLRQSIQMGKAASAQFALAYLYVFLAQALLGQERTADALDAARRALQLGQETGLQVTIGEAWRTLGAIAARLPGPISIQDRLCDAVKCFEESQRIFAEMGMAGERARTLCDWARYEIERGDRAQGETMWQEARETFARLGMQREAERMGAQRMWACGGMEE